jgi:hypothetical protein
MDLFAQYISKNLKGPTLKPDWIKRARRNGLARVRRLAKKLNISKEEAHERLAHELELKQQGED